MTRREKLLAGLDLSSMVGLEIGPLDRPTLRKDETRILYADHLDTASLRQKYAADPNVVVGNIGEVDAVWGERTLAEALGPDTKVDYVIASHVIEHVPDLVSWLQEVRAVLKPGGQVRLLVPDKRFTFDLYRRETAFSDVLTAYLVRARKPLLHAVVDFALFCTPVDLLKAWDGTMARERALTREDFNRAFHLGRDVVDNGTYHDVHCWVVTPRSFATLFAEMAEFGLHDFACAAFHDTEPHELEFCVALQECSDPVELTESWRRMARTARIDRDVPDGIGQLQEKTITALSDWGAAERARARAELARSFERSRADQAEHGRWEAKALRESAEARAKAAEAAAQESEAETRQAQETVARLVRERDALLSSGVWQATRLLRALVRRVPAPLRSLTSRALGRARRAVGGQAGGTAAAAMREQVARIEASGLFDAGWYVREYRDLQSSNMPPAMHYLLHGGAEGRNPGPDFDSAWYLAANRDVAAAGVNPLLHFIDQGRAEGRLPKPPEDRESVGPPSVHAMLRRHFAGLQPLRIFPAPGMPPRLTMITDSINPGSLFGGVGTAMILAALLAERRGLQLRLITRSEPPETLNFQRVLDLNNIPWKSNIEFVHAGIGERAREIPLGADELFLTTSWWSTRSTRQAVDPRNIVYLLQEDERMFYPHGDDWLRCVETMADPQLHFVVNSELLFEHMARGPLPVASIAANGVWFEPAFPAAAAGADDATAAQARRRRHGFFFYARPGNERNLYYRGLEAIGAAMEAGALRPEDWDIYFVGRDLEPITLPGGVRPALLENLDWADYQTLVRRIDVGLSLMYTPHPSYPPLDLAASGAAVVTNRYGSKTTLARYAEDILCVEPSVDALAGGIVEAVRRVEQGGRPRGANRLQHDWAAALEPVLQHLDQRL